MRGVGMLIQNMFPLPQISTVNYDVYARKGAGPHSSGGSFDTVAISEEARAAYAMSPSSSSALQGKSQISGIFSSPEDRDFTARLTAWFNSTHSGSNAVIGGDVIVDSGSGTLLPENTAIKENLENQIDKVLDTYNYALPATASPEMLEELQPLWHKLNAIAALGDTMIMTDEVLEKATPILQNLEDTWSRGRELGTTTESQLRTALSGRGDTPGNRLSEEERARKIKEDAMKKMTEEA